jgi:hypothetical protein
MQTLLTIGASSSSLDSIAANVRSLFFFFGAGSFFFGLTSSWGSFFGEMVRGPPRNHKAGKGSQNGASPSCLTEAAARPPVRWIRRLPRKAQTPVQLTDLVSTARFDTFVDPKVTKRAGTESTLSLSTGSSL